MTTYELSDVTTTIDHAISEGIIPEDIVQSINMSMEVFRVDASSFGADGSQGKVKYAELVLKLGYWLAIRKLTPDGFRTLKARFPHDYNNGWEVVDGMKAREQVVEPIVCAPSGGSGGSFGEGDRYYSDGSMTGGWSGSGEQLETITADEARPQKTGCLLALALAPFALIGKLIERLFAQQ